jgi:hypothetical protein
MGKIAKYATKLPSEQMKTKNKKKCWENFYLKKDWVGIGIGKRQIASLCKKCGKVIFFLIKVK